MLEHGGILGRADRKRLVVTLPKTDTVGRSVSSALLMHHVTYEQLWQVAMGLEPLASKLACTTANNNDKKLLAENLEQTREVMNDHDALLAAEIEFHDLLANATHNSALLLARAPLNELFYPIAWVKLFEHCLLVSVLWWPTNIFTMPFVITTQIKPKSG